MEIVTLVSGGFDSTLMSILLKEANISQLPLFVDYGQLCVEREWAACRRLHRDNGLPAPRRIDLSDYGRVIPSGLTTRKLRLNEDGYLPGRNLLFLLVAAAYAVKNGAGAVAIGLLKDEHKIFEDQSQAFVASSEKLLQLATASNIRMLTPLMTFTKADILKIWKERRLRGAYSCHAGTRNPCGECISCKERNRSLA